LKWGVCVLGRNPYCCAYLLGYERELINGGRELPSAHSWIGERGWISCRLIHSSTSRKKRNGCSFATVIVWMMREIILHPLFFCAWTEGSSFLLLLSFTEERICLINTGYTLLVNVLLSYLNTIFDSWYLSRVLS
jgi:hypothetical protein